MSIFNLPSPLQELKSPFLTEKGVELWVKREDLIHPIISGNKWRKLKYNIKKAKEENCTTVLTFGGAFSNHLHATAATCQHLGLRSIGVIRGEKPTHLSDTLKECQACGMELHYVSRADYRLKTESNFVSRLKELHGEFYLVPEGGANEEGVRGCEDILKEVTSNFDYIALSAGTGTTAAGILRSCKKESLLIFPALKGGAFLSEDILSYQIEQSNKEQLLLFNEYHFGGYAKIKDELIAFVRKFYEEYRLKLDLVYTGKLFFGLMDLIHKGYFEKGTKILTIHTGGLQGNKGMEQKIGEKLFIN